MSNLLQIFKEDKPSNQGIFPWVKLSIEVITMVGLVYVGLKISSDLIGVLTADSVNQAETKKKISKKLKKPNLELLDLNEFELKLAGEVLIPSEISTSFDDIGGMEKEITLVKENIILPMKVWEKIKHENKSVPIPTGILLYGKPGTGKTFTARAIAKEANATFLPIKSSHIHQKFIGEGEKVITAIFSLARKLAPCVIFMDEIDTLFMDRNAESMSGGNPYAAKYLGTMLAEWDGITESSKAPVLVLAATNRPQDLDKAFLRRLPMSIKMKAPNLEGRVDILTKMLIDDTLGPDVDLTLIAKQTENYTGSDLRELIRVTKLEKLKSDWLDSDGNFSSSSSLPLPPSSSSSSANDGISDLDKSKDKHDRPLSMENFNIAISKSILSSEAALDYSKEIVLETLKERQDVLKSVLGSVSSTKQANKFNNDSYIEEVLDASFHGNQSDCDE